MDLTCDEEMLSVSVSPGGQQDKNQQQNREMSAGSPSNSQVNKITIVGRPLDTVHFASLEPILVNDPRVLQNMLRSEEHNLPSVCYFKMVQTDITPEMRGSVSTWMFEVCEEEHVPESVFLRAITYVDRFLSIHNIRRTHFQLLGAACLLISSKWSGSLLSTERLVFYTAHSVTASMILEWEMMILNQFKWDMFTITPSDFVEPILHRLPQQHLWDSQTVRDKIKTYNAYCATDYKFCIHPPSMIASACIAAAIGTRVNREILDDILNQIHQLTTIETMVERSPSLSPPNISNSASTTSASGVSGSSTSEATATACPPDRQEVNTKRFDVLKSCMEQLQARIEEMIRENSQVPGPNPGVNEENVDDTMSSGANKLGELEQAETPTDVRDVHF